MHGGSTERGRKRWRQGFLPPVTGTNIIGPALNIANIHTLLLLYLFGSSHTGFA